MYFAVTPFLSRTKIEFIESCCSMHENIINRVCCSTSICILTVPLKNENRIHRSVAACLIEDSFFPEADSLDSGRPSRSWPPRSGGSRSWPEHTPPPCPSAHRSAIRHGQAETCALCGVGSDHGWTRYFWLAIWCQREDQRLRSQDESIPFLATDTAS